MEQYLKEIIAGSYLTELQDKGIVDSIMDDNNEERFFLTDLGKKIANEKD
jgi:predicted transcriptional regulator